MAAHRFTVWQAEDGAAGGQLLQPVVLPDGTPLLLAPLRGRPNSIRVPAALAGGKAMALTLQPVPGSPGVYRCQPGMPGVLNQLQFIAVL